MILLLSVGNVEQKTTGISQNLGADNYNSVMLLFLECDLQDENVYVSLQLLKSAIFRIIRAQLFISTNNPSNSNYPNNWITIWLAQIILAFISD